MAGRFKALISEVACPGLTDSPCVVISITPCMWQALNSSWNMSRKRTIYNQRRSFRGSLAVFLEVFESVICWTRRMIPSCINWWLSYQEQSDFPNLGLCFLFLYTAWTYWSYSPRARSQQLRFLIERWQCFCFRLSSCWAIQIGILKIHFIKLNCQYVLLSQ